MNRCCGKQLIFAGAGALALLIASIDFASAASIYQTPPGAFGARVELAGCWWAQGAWGPHRICREDDYDNGHYDWHPGHWQRHYDHYDYRPGHWDYHHRGHRHHMDEGD